MFSSSASSFCFIFLFNVTLILFYYFNINFRIGDTDETAILGNGDDCISILRLFFAKLFINRMRSFSTWLQILQPFICRF